MKTVSLVFHCAANKIVHLLALSHHIGGGLSLLADFSCYCSLNCSVGGSQYTTFSVVNLSSYSALLNHLICHAMAADKFTERIATFQLIVILMLAF